MNLEVKKTVFDILNERNVNKSELLFELGKYHQNLTYLQVFDVLTELLYSGAVYVHEKYYYLELTGTEWDDIGHTLAARLEKMNNDA